MKEFGRLAERLAGDGVVVKPVFGERGLMLRGKSLGCRYGVGVALRLGAGTAEHARALALEGAEPFDPAARDRPMTDWVVVPAAHAAQWYDLALAARDRLG
jgi:hypothetical protein